MSFIVKRLYLLWTLLWLGYTGWHPVMIGIVLLGAALLVEGLHK